MYTYDRIGRLTCTDDSEGNTVSYTYDEAGNVSGITYPDGGVISYKYDKNNNLISVRDATGQETRYSYYVNREYTQVLMERDGSGALSTAYVYGNERLSVRSTKKESGYYLYDGRGSVTGIVSILGERLESYSYDPSGQAMRATSTNRYQKTFYGYNAESYDPKTGSVYLRARYYNTRTGSFSTKDTYLGDLMEPLSLNRYSYTWGNPVNYQDPSGHEKIVVSGGQYSTFAKFPPVLGTNKFDFIACAIKLINEYLENDEQGEPITWIIADAGWSWSEKEAFKMLFDDPRVNVIFVSDADELINYINSKDTNCEEISEAREKDPITEFTVFSHGLRDNGGTLSLGYNYFLYKWWLNMDKGDIESIKDGTFAAESHSTFYSCNTAFGVEDSFAARWSNKSGGYVTAFNGKTDYAGIYLGEQKEILKSIFRRLGIFTDKAATNNPVPGNKSDSEEKTDTINYYDGEVVE